MAVSFANVTVAYDRNPPNYTAGETIRLTVNGQAVNTTDPTTTTEQWGAFSIPVTAAGALSFVEVPAATVTRSTPGSSTNEPVFIDAAAGSTLVLGGRSFVVAADRKSISVVA